MRHNWTNKEVRLALSLRREGAQLKVIARRLGGGITWNAVRHRLRYERVTPESRIRRRADTQAWKLRTRYYERKRKGTRIPPLVLPAHAHEARA